MTNNQTTNGREELEALFDEKFRDMWRYHLGNRKNTIDIPYPLCLKDFIFDTILPQVLSDVMPKKMKEETYNQAEDVQDWMLNSKYNEALKDYQQNALTRYGIDLSKNNE